jgi:hypothetical protein
MSTFVDTHCHVIAVLLPWSCGSGGASSTAKLSEHLNNKPSSPYVLRHTSAMRLLHAGVDTTVIALWLGHETTRTTDIYLHADLALKERALARTTPLHTPRPPGATAHRTASWPS